MAGYLLSYYIEVWKGVYGRIANAEYTSNKIELAELDVLFEELKASPGCVKEKMQ